MAQLLEACTIVLEIKPEIGPDQAHPLLSTTFRENGRDLIKLQIAGYFKAVVDGKRPYHPEASGFNDQF